MVIFLVFLITVLFANFAEAIAEARGKAQADSNKIIFANDQATEILNVKRIDIIDHYAPDIAVNNDLFRALSDKARITRVRSHPWSRLLLMGRKITLQKKAFMSILFLPAKRRR